MRNTSSSGWDHPRACGEKKYDPVADADSTGSPPRVRGKAWISWTARSCCGITPARAGKSSPCLPGISRCWDHPRACGEKTYYNNMQVRQLGSPPRARGKAYIALCCKLAQGITPACAGKRRQ